MDGDGSYDPCECFWNHEMDMRRLLSLLRQSQSVCTDTECFDVAAPPQNQPVDSNFLLMSIFTAFAVVMFFMRLRANRLNDRESPTKANDRLNLFDDEPPTPPPTSS